MHIPLGHREIGVPGQFLNGTDGGTPHRQMGTKRVAQDVNAEVRQACATCHTSDPALHHLPREWTPVRLAQHQRSAQVSMFTKRRGKS